MSVYLTVETDGYDAFGVIAVYDNLAAAESHAEYITARNRLMQGRSEDEWPTDYGDVAPFSVRPEFLPSDWDAA